jgi:hypothetical protein
MAMLEAATAAAAKYLMDIAGSLRVATMIGMLLLLLTPRPSAVTAA